MRMREVKGYDIPAKGSFELKPGGSHLMLVDLKRPLKEGDKVPVVLRFEKSGEVKVDFEVRPLGARGIRPPPALTLEELASDPPREPGHEGRAGDGEDPRPDDVAGDAPAHRRHRLRRADADDRAGDGVRGRHRDAERGRQEQRDRARQLGAEAADRASAW